MKLSNNFLHELFLLCFKKREVIEACCKHLEYHFLPDESLKKIWKYMKVSFLSSDHKTLPSIGVASQKFIKDLDVAETILQIKEAETVDTEIILTQLEEFIKDGKSLEAYERFSELYNEGKKDKARLLLKDAGEDLANFTIRTKTSYKPVFGGFEQRHLQRLLESKDSKFDRRVPFSIDELDGLTMGGIDIKDTACFVARSGVGKTKLLRHIGVGAARRGFPVLHIQAEGSEEECLNGYDATWTAVVMSNLKSANINKSVYDKLTKTIGQIAVKKSDIYVHAFEQFGSGSMMDVRNLVLDFQKIHGYSPALVIVDYLEKLDPGNGKRYLVSEEKQRRQDIADMMKNLCLSENTRLVTATQASDIPTKEWNDPDWVMTRHNVSMTKNLPDAFSYFITLNQTRDEYDHKDKKGVPCSIMRLYNDKLRNYKANQIMKIYQNYNHDRFYNRQKTLNEFYELK